MTRSAWLLTRMDLIRRPVAVILLTILVGTMFGGAIAAAAGARRSSSALNRFVAYNRGDDTGVYGDPGTIRHVG